MFNITNLYRNLWKSKPQMPALHPMFLWVLMGLSSVHSRSLTAAPPSPLLKVYYNDGVYMCIFSWVCVWCVWVGHTCHSAYGRIRGQLHGSLLPSLQRFLESNSGYQAWAPSALFLRLPSFLLIVIKTHKIYHLNHFLGVFSNVTYSPCCETNVQSLSSCKYTNDSAHLLPIVPSH